MTTRAGPGFQLHSVDMTDCLCCGQPLGPRGAAGWQTMEDATRPTLVLVPVCRKCFTRLQRGSEREKDELGRRLSETLARVVPAVRLAGKLPYPGQG